MTRQTGQPTPDALDALSASWDALVAGDQPGDAGTGEPLAAVARRLHAADDTPALAAPARARIWQQILGASAPAVGPGGFTSNGHADSSPARDEALLAPLVVNPRPRPVSRPRWLAAQLATAALVVVTVGLAYLVSTANRERTSETPRIPAPDVPETVLAVTIPADYFPTWEVAATELARYAFPAGASAMTDITALRVEVVVSGAYSVRSDGPSQVVRAGKVSVEDVPTGTTTELGEGDALLAPPETVSEYTNAGDLAQMLTWSLFVNDRSASLARGWAFLDGDMRTGLKPQPGATALHLQRIVLAPDSTFPAPPDALQLSLVWTDSADDALTRFDLARTTAGALRNLGDAPIAVYVVTVAAAASTSLMP
jgi:hypothetical protein